MLPSLKPSRPGSTKNTVLLKTAVSEGMTFANSVAAPTQPVFGHLTRPLVPPASASTSLKNASVSSPERAEAYRGAGVLPPEQTAAVHELWPVLPPVVIQ